MYSTTTSTTTSTLLNSFNFNQLNNSNTNPAINSPFTIQKISRKPPSIKIPSTKQNPSLLELKSTHNNRLELSPSHLTNHHHHQPLNHYHLISPTTIKPAISIETNQQHVFCQGKRFGLSLKDFRVICTLGTGTFGKVLLVRLDRSITTISDHHHHHQHQQPKPQQYYAIKVLSKTQVVRLKQVEHVNSEKDLLALVSSRSASRFSQFFVSLICTFQDHKNLYMLQEFVEGGELFSHLRRAGRFTADVARFYGSNVILAFEGLHEMDIIYRDLKPENLLLGLNGYLKLTDFGFAKRVPDRTWTLCGTPEYLAPEIIQSKGHGKSADWWAFGILLYELLAGHPPFFNPDPSSSPGPFPIYEKILQCHLLFPPLPPPSSPRSPPSTTFDLYSIDLIKRLLVIDRSKRLGNLKGGISDIKNHPWFRGVDWSLLAQQVIPAPIIPKVSQPGDSSNFERYPNVHIDDLPGFQPDTPPPPPPSLAHPPHHLHYAQLSPSSNPYYHLDQFTLDPAPKLRPFPCPPSLTDHDPFRHLFESF